MNPGEQDVTVYERLQRLVDADERTRERDLELYECDECGSVGIGTGDGSMTCCDRAMASVDADRTVDGPDVKRLLRDVFGLSETGVAVCLHAMDAGEVTVEEIADREDLDRSSATRTLNDLVDLGVLEKRRTLLDQGGYLYRYRSVAPESVRRRLGRELLLWTADGLALLDELHRQKLELVSDERTDRRAVDNEQSAAED